MKRTLAALAGAAVLLAAPSAQAGDVPRAVAASSTVADHSYVTLTVHFAAPVPAAVSRITATGYAGRCVPGHCTYATFVLVPYNAERTVWIDTEVVSAPGAYVVTSVQLVPVAVGYPVKVTLGALPFRVSA